MNNNDSKSKIGKMRLFLIVALVACSKLLKFSFIVGSSRCFFSLINITGPLVTCFGGFPIGIGILLLNSAIGFKSGLLFSGLLASNGLPNFLAGLYLRFNAQWFKIGVPLLSIGLFWYSTWGTIAAPYALLWLIPLVINWLKIENIYGKALAATFVAHGVGSVIWLYLANLTPMQWFALIPVAVCERIFLAILIGSVYNLGQYILTQYVLVRSFAIKASLQPKGTFL